MHRIAVPKRSGVHRFACLALYRALLRQCTKLPSSAPKLSTVKSLVQKKFHQFKALQSPSQTANALKAGYEALDLLHAASQKDKDGVNRISAILAESRSLSEEKGSRQRKLAKARVPEPLTAKQQRREESKEFQKMTAVRHPDAEPILSRPRPVVSGKRRVPVLVNARGVPFLRIKKPQPKNLSGVIRSKLENRWKRIERRDRLHMDLHFAGDEDAWDRLTEMTEPVQWVDEIRTAIKEVNQKIREGDAKNMALAKAMWEVVLAERKLAEEEEKQKALEQ